MLIYLAAPYSSIGDKKKLMQDFVTFAGRYMVENPSDQIVSPLFNHFCLEHVPELGSDWSFWKNYSEALMKRCDKLIVLAYDGWKESPGVQAEIKLSQEIGLDAYIIHF